MVVSTWRLQQTIFKSSHPPFTVTQVGMSDLLTATEALDDVSAATTAGIACIYGAKGVLNHLAFATITHVLCIRINAPRKSARSKRGKKAQGNARQEGRDALRQMLGNVGQLKLGWDMNKISTALHYDHNLTVVRAVDLQSIKPAGDRQSEDMLMTVLGGSHNVNKEHAIDTFLGNAYEDGSIQNLALRAWTLVQVGRLSSLTKQLSSIAVIDTSALAVEDLQWLAKFTRVSSRLHALKPTRVKNDVCAEFKKNNDQLHLSQTRFKTRMRHSRNQTLEVEVTSERGNVDTLKGRTVRTEGKSADITVNKAISSTSKIRSIVTVGRDDPTYSDRERELVVLWTLQRKVRLFQQTLARKIFFPSRAASQSEREAATRIPHAKVYLAGRCLNDSQAAAVHRIISSTERDRVCLIHGPPGTGKTTVIAASVIEISVSEGNRGIWLVAQSNVAVKNIAEKLAGVGFWDFKVLVSKDFHFEWHEHLYEKIQRNVIQSDEYPDNYVGTARLLLDSKVILCTLSMLAHPRLMPSGFTRLVPVETVIVDEASQIELGDYLPMLNRFHRSIKKLVFIGDDKQLAPHGQDDLGDDVQSIFELQHLRQDALFLDTQYRMPIPIGEFISRHVYDGQLKSSHSITSRQSCKLVDISNGKEEKSGNSWKNAAEADAVVTIARKLKREGKTYRVITPYDGQRNLLEQRLQNADLPWENKCFNVDSFQGNEDDYIIISLVRSEKIGFLSNMRRTNVMLSRCKRGMIICTNRAFVQGKANSSLVGKLVAEWGDAWVTRREMLQGRF